MLGHRWSAAASPTVAPPTVAPPISPLRYEVRFSASAETYDLLRSRHIPAAVRWAVSDRDRKRCAFLGSGGRRCDARRFLEFHHLKPFAVGGKATVDNIQLRCRAHNRHEADLFYGPMRSDGDSHPPVPERVDRAMSNPERRIHGLSSSVTVH
jgi:hypothetical protein